MVTFNGGRDAHLKMLRLAREKRKKEFKEKVKLLDNLSGIDKLEYEIARLKNTIYLCKADLKNPDFKNNISIIKKLKNAEKMLKIKEEELKNAK